MQSIFYASLRRTISTKRCDSYRLVGESELDVLARYAWNIALCEALYPALQNLEIALRNNIHTAATRHFGTNHWFDMHPTILKPRERDMVTSVKNTLTDIGKPLEADRIVAELMFGFWSNLLNSPYEQRQILWPRLLVPVFPHIARHLRTRVTASKRFSEVRKLRNRIFHHEPIWNQSGLLQKHSEILEAIGWMSPTLHNLTQVLDRFPAVHAQGPLAYKAELAKLL